MAESRKDEKEVLSDIKTLFEHLKTKRKVHEGEWQDVTTYIGSKNFDWEEAKDEVKRPKRHTGRPAEYLDKLVSGLMGYTISPNVTWLKLSLSDSSMLDYSGVKDWLENAEKALYEEFNRNNLYTEAPAFISNAAQFGHGVMLIDEKKETAIRFMTVSAPEVYIAINEYGDIDTVCRYFSMTVKNIVARFGLESVSDTILKDYEDAQGKQKEVKILHAVFPREAYDSDKLDDKNMAYASYYVDMDGDAILEESGYHELPYSVFIWERITASAYGDSPARKAIPDMRLLNKAEEARLKLAQLAAEPPMNVPDSMRGVESVVPAGFNYYESPDEIMMPAQMQEKQMQAMQQQQEALMGNYDKLNEPVKEGSPIQELSEQLQTGLGGEADDGA